MNSLKPIILVMLSRITTLLLLLLFASCGYSDKDLSFTDYDRRFLPPFKKGDTILYESSKKDIYIVIISDIDSAQKSYESLILPAFKRLTVKIRYKASYYNAILKRDIDQKNRDTLWDDMFNMMKYPGSKSIYYTFQFRDFAANEYNVSQLRVDTINIDGSVIKNYYVIKSGYPEKDTTPTSIQQLYWTKNDGIVAYKYTNGIYWVKKGKRLYQ